MFNSGIPKKICQSDGSNGPKWLGGGLFADLEDNVEKSLPWTDEALRVPADKDEEVVFFEKHFHSHFCSPNSVVANDGTNVGPSIYFEEASLTFLVKAILWIQTYHQVRYAGQSCDVRIPSLVFTCSILFMYMMSNFLSMDTLTVKKIWNNQDTTHFSS